MKKIAWFLAFVMLAAATLPALAQDADPQDPPAQTETAPQEVTQEQEAGPAWLPRAIRRFKAAWNPHHEFVDKDGDGLCDSCQLPKEAPEQPDFVDEDGDGLCDNCGSQPGAQAPGRQQKARRMLQRIRTKMAQQKSGGQHNGLMSHQPVPGRTWQPGQGEPQGPGPRRQQQPGQGRFGR